MKDVIHSFKKRKVLVIGDCMVDRYTVGRSTRISPEAPVPVVLKEREYSVLGGAANVAHNTAALGAKTILCGVIGDDSTRKEFVALLKQANITPVLIVDPTRPTTLKHRWMSGTTQLARVDEEAVHPLGSKQEKEMIRNIVSLVPKVDIVILSDYAKGCLTPRVVAAVRAAAKKHKKKIVADIKPGNHAHFVGVDLIVPNVAEAAAMSGESDLNKVGQRLVKTFKSHVYITRGGEGISVFHRSGETAHVPAKKVTVYDVSGAGDTVTAVAALGMAASVDLIKLAGLANAAGGIVVQKVGTSVVTPEDLLSASTFHVESLQTVEKVWGAEKWLENNDKYCCKQLSIHKGFQCSLHYHKLKDEMFFLTKGHVRLELGDEIIFLREGNFVRVPIGVPHRFRGLEDSIIIEVSTHHDEEDSYRIKGEESRKVKSHEK